MSIDLLNRVNIMIDEKLNPSRIFRTMAKALIIEPEIWGSNNDFLRLRNVALTDSIFKTTLRSLCTESKSKQFYSKEGIAKKMEY
ncbi:hypothetical protein BpHYR1_040464 [Brachionus plicatilis]|uniref:Uncharacterized protein n=1 Tax=Brachionus plicatilis TaxID=10195 RepID=A0A3M7RDY9_BRAPC|nr:hypothetical protein BpHYR1_040464 [Brachionus plicatilis]